MPRLEEDPAAFPRVIPSGLPMSANKTASWRSLRPEIDAGLCTGCLICWKFCPECCLRLDGKVPTIALAYCKGCGICAAECPAGCVRMVPEGSRW